MPIDPISGLYSEGVHRTPGGLGAAVSGLSSMKAASLARRRRALEELENTLALTKDPETAAAILDSPEGRALLSGAGVSEAPLTSAIQRSPRRRFEEGLKGLGKRPETEDVMMLGVQSGYVTPSQFATSGVRLESQDVRRRKAASEFAKSLYVRERANNVPSRDAAQTAIAMTRAFHPDMTPEDTEAVFSGLSSELSRAEEAKVSKTEEEAKAIPIKTAAQAEWFKARAEAARMNAKTRALRGGTKGGAKPPNPEKLRRLLNEAMRTSLAAVAAAEKSRDPAAIEEANAILAEARENRASLRKQLSGAEEVLPTKPAKAKAKDPLGIL